MTDDDRKVDLSMKKLIIFDFDGTLTDAEQEGSPFRKGYLDDIAALSNLDRDQVEVLATQYEQEVAENPGQYGWVFQGQIVAPATVDPYLRMMPVARKIVLMFISTYCLLSHIIDVIHYDMIIIEKSVTIFFMMPIILIHERSAHYTGPF